MNLATLLVICIFATCGAHAGNHCVCVDDPYGGANHICDYGCINAPCYICAEMCLADGGRMSQCTTCSGGGGGTCKKEDEAPSSLSVAKKTPGAVAYAKHVSVPLKGMDGTSCNTEWYFTDTNCSLGYPLVLGTCYNAQVHLDDGFFVKNDNSIKVECTSTSCEVQTFKDTSCSDLDYHSGMSDACQECFVINPLLTMKINGKRILWHGLGGPPSYDDKRNLKMQYRKNN